MAPRSLAAFLKAARSALTAPASQRSKPLTIVVGNESADLDSLCSAILLAYFRSHTPPHNASIHVPLCNLPRADLILRPELQAALAGSSSVPKPDSKSGPGPTPGAQGGVPLDSLITLSELPDDLEAADTKWLLVDHNALTGDLGKRFQSSVVGCIDHHVDEGVVPAPKDDEYPRTIETCGSCASLVVDYAKDAWRKLAEQEPDLATDRVLARLALAPILIDTSSLKSANKTTDMDRQSAAIAEAVLGQKEGSGAEFAAYETDVDYNRTAYYDELSRLKNDLSTFSYSDILRKDYKQWKEDTTSNGPLTVGFSTVSQGLGYLLKNIGDRDALLDGLKKHADERELDIAVIMTVQHDEGGFARQLLLWAFNEQGVKAVKGFVETNTENVDLKPWGDGQLDSSSEAKTDNEWRTCWAHNTKFSRKQMAPLLRDAMKSS